MNVLTPSPRFSVCPVRWRRVAAYGALAVSCIFGSASAGRCESAQKKVPVLCDLAAQPVTWTHAFEVIAFIDPECPAAAMQLPALSRVRTEFTGSDVGFSVAYVDPQKELAALRDHAREYAPAFTAIDDRQQRLARFTGATYLAEVVILDTGGELRYRGRIDNRVDAPGGARPAATRHDLRDALVKLLAGKTIPVDGPKGFGCALPERVAP